MNKTQWSLVGLLLGCVLSLNGQPTYQDYEKLKLKYPNNDAVLVNSDQTFTLKIDGENIDIKGDFFTRFLYLSDKALGSSERSVAYAPDFYEISSIEANSYTLEPNRKYKRYKVSNFVDENRITGSIFYDGIKYRKFVMPSITQGTFTDTKYSYTYLEPEYLGAYFFKRHIPVDKGTFTVIVHDQIQIDYKFFGDTSGIVFTKTNQKGVTTYKWEISNAGKLKSYDDAADDRYYEPHVFVYVTEYTTEKKKKVKLAGNIDDLYRNNYRYIENVNKTAPNDDVKQVVDSIRNISANDFEKAKNTYYWVQRNMKYIAFEDGLGGQIPRESNDVIQKKYGDCKDFAALICYMLQQLNVSAYLVWIGTRELPYSYEQLPSGYASNHMIAAVFLNNKWLFIDGTSKHSAFGVPSSFIQGKDALIAISRDSFAVVKVPIMPPEYNYSNSIIDLTINKDVLEGKTKLVLAGYNRDSWVSEMYYTGSDKMEKNIKEMLAVGNNKCEVLQYEVKGQNENDADLVFNYDFKLPNYIKIIDHDIYVNMHLRKYYTDEKIDTAENRVLPKEYSFTFKDEGTYTLQIPDGYTVKKLPENSSYQNDFFSYSFTYNVVGNKIVFHKASRCSKLMIEQASFDAWNKQIEEIQKRYKDLIILTRK